jgi:NCK-associated protein 1
MFLPVYADVTCHPHQEMEQLISSHKEKKLKLDRFKRVPKEALAHFGSSAGSAHRARRIYARQELEALLGLARDTPSLLCPKLAVYLAALSFGKGEALLYYRHRAAVLAAEKGSKVLKEADWADGRVPELVQCITNLSRLIWDSSEMISRYYAEFLAGADAAAAKSALDRLSSVPGPAHSIAERIVSSLSSSSPDSILSGQLDLPSLRRDCLSLELSLSLETSRSSSSVSEQAQVFRLVSTHSRYIDSLSELLESSASLLDLFYLRDVVRESFDSHLRSPLASAGAGGAAAAAPTPAGDSTPTFWAGPTAVASYFRLLEAFPNVASSYWPEERELVGSECVKSCTEFLDKATLVLRENLSLCISANLSHNSQLRERNGFDFSAMRKADWKPPKDWSPPPQPGSESAFPNRAALEPVRIAMRNSGLILKALNEVGVVTIYDSQIAPAEFVREMLAGFLQEWLRNAFKLTPPDMAIERPSEIYKQFQVVLNTISYFEHFITLNLEALWREVMVSEFWTRDVGQFGVPDILPLIEADFGGRPIGNIVLWYANFVIKVLCQPNSGIVYSPNRKSFVSRPGMPLRAEHYVEYSEMRSLTLLTGPYGVKLIDGWLLRYIHAQMAGIKDIVISNAVTLEEIGLNYTREAKFVESLKKIRDLDLFMQRSVALGNALALRAMIKEALKDNVADYTPHLHSAISTAFDHYPRNTFIDPALLPLDLLAYDYGMDMASADQAMKAVLKKVHQEGDQKMWQLLPVMFAIVFTSATWKEAVYMPAIEAYNNNVGVTARSIVSLIVGFCAITLPVHDEKPIAAFFKDFVEISATILLRMARTPRGDKKGPVDFPSMIIFLDKFVEQCEYVKRDTLETCMPYSLLRSMYKEVYAPGHHSPEGW